MKGEWLHQVLIVGAGGFVGAVCRFGLSGLVHRLAGAGFPYGTLAVNVLGCFAIGLLGGLSEARQVLGSQARLFLLLGLLGGFTTFSTFAFETLALGRDGELARALANVLTSVLLCLVGVWIGYRLALR